MINVVVLNFAGTVGKSTITKQVIAPMLGGAEWIQIESINNSAIGADSELNARQFRGLAEKLAVPTSNRVIDIGGSNVESVLKQMSEMDGIQEDISWWIIPVDERVKVVIDTLNTIDHLVNNLNVNAQRIVVIPNNIEFPDEMKAKLSSIYAASQAVGFHVSAEPLLKSDIFDLVKDLPNTILDIAADMTDLEALISNERDPERLAELGKRKVHRRMSRHIAKNIRAVWDSTPMGAKTIEMA